MPDDIPANLRELFDAAGPVVRFRLVRDVLSRDESWIQTAHLGVDVARVPEVRTLIAAQQMDGSWGGTLAATADACLRLCELGMESGEAIQICLEKALLPTLVNPDLIWEYELQVKNDASRRVARHLVRDRLLHLICRATRDYDELLKPFLEMVLAEWNRFLSLVGGKLPIPPDIPLPTADGYAAVCWYGWSDDDFERVHPIVARLMKYAENALDHPMAVVPLYGPHLFTVRDKVEYVVRPDLLFHDLELSARFGATREQAVSNWLLDEMEARQDADGWFRLDLPQPVKPWWYFPLEKSATGDDSVEWSFRAELILHLLEFDI